MIRRQFKKEDRLAIESGTVSVETRDGRPVRILCFDGNDPHHPIVGYIGDCWHVDKWDLDGNFSDHNSDADIFVIEQEFEIKR